MKSNLRSVSMALGLLGLFACSSGEDLPDASVEVDMGFAVDAGVRALCPLTENNPTCTAASDCADDLDPPASCTWCRKRNNAVCVLGQCAEPERINGNQFVNFSFRAPNLETVLLSYAGYAVTQETTGGNTLTCAEILSESVSWDEPCYNIIDARYADNSNREGDTFPLRFSTIPGGLDVLVVAYAFDTDLAASQPIGVACAEVTVPEKDATTEPTLVSGGEMTDLR